MTAPSPSSPPSESESEFESARTPVVEALSRLGPTRLVLVGALVAFQGLIRLAERTLPAVVLESGFGPIAIGALGSLALAVSLGIRRADADGDVETDGRLPSSRALPLLATVLAVAGLLVWTGAHSFDALLGTSLSALGWFLLGAALLGPWHARGPGRHLSPGDGGLTVVPAPAGRRSKPTGDGRGADRDEDRDGGESATPLVLATLGLGGGAILATAAFAGTDTVRAGFALVASSGAAVGLVAVVAFALDVLESAPESEPVAETEPGAETEAAPESGTRATGVDSLPGSAPGPGFGRAPFELESIRDALESLPDVARRTIVGDALVRFAVVSTSLFFVLVVVEHHANAATLTIGSTSLPPIAAFSLFVLAEATGALVGVLAAPALADVADDRVGRRWPLVGGLTAVSLVPLTLVATSNPAILALAFAVFGCRTVVRPLRPTVRTAGPTRVRNELPDAIGLGVHLALVPAPLVGGALYALSPVAAFALATSVGLLGVRELLKPLEESDRTLEEGDGDPFEDGTSSPLEEDDG